MENEGKGREEEKVLVCQTTVTRRKFVRRAKEQIKKRNNQING